MPLRAVLRVALLLLLTFSVRPSPAAEAPLAAEARAALARATAAMRSLATEGGYLWRYSPDLSERAGENPATATQIWIQNPGTPAMGLFFLDAYEATGEAAYLEAARDAADALVEGQLASGGWDYLIEFDPEKRNAWYRRSDQGQIPAADAARRRNTSTYDDDNTQQALRFLVALTTTDPTADEPRARRHREARDYGLAKLIEAQRPNGGWPQRWNGQPADPSAYPDLTARFPDTWAREHPKTSYYDHYTLNDDTQRDCILTLLDAARRLDRPDYRAAALRGGEFLLKAQLPEPQPGWAQQYNARMEPAWARAFEPPGISSRETTGVMCPVLAQVDRAKTRHERKENDKVQ
jgi:PelA/Pel-15E family pectate lyase